MNKIDIDDIRDRVERDRALYDYSDLIEMLDQLDSYQSVLERIADFGKTNPNAPFVRAMKQPLIDWAEDALGRTPQVPVSHEDEPVSGLG